MNIQNLTIVVDHLPIVHNLSLVVNAGQTHVIMGHNGSGKSTLAYALAGHPLYAIVSGTIMMNGTDITNFLPEQRAKQGVFLACQHPIALPGVSVFTFLTEAYRALVSAHDSVEHISAAMSNALYALGLDNSFLARSVHDGFSGGEKKRFEMVQAILFKPAIMILDEIDSGLDLDALKLVGQALDGIKKERPDTRIILITHYPKILTYLTPDLVHIMHEGRLVCSGGYGLVEQIELRGYDETISIQNRQRS